MTYSYLLSIKLQCPLWLEVVLLCALEQAKLTGDVLHLAGTLAGGYAPLPPPTVDIAASEDAIGFTLAYHFRVGAALGNHARKACRNIVDKGGVGNHPVGELKLHHSWDFKRYDTRVAVMVRSSRLVVVENFLSHWRPKLVQMDLI